MALDVMESFREVMLSLKPGQRIVVSVEEKYDDPGNPHVTCFLRLRKER